SGNPLSPARASADAPSAAPSSPATAPSSPGPSSSGKGLTLDDLADRASLRDEMKKAVSLQAEMQKVRDSALKTEWERHRRAQSQSINKLAGIFQTVFTKDS